ERLALVEGEQAAQLVAALLDRLGDPVQPLRALESFQLRHRATRFVRGFYSALRIDACALRDLGDDLAGGGTVRVKELPALRLDPVTVDKHLSHRPRDIDGHF